MSDPRPIRILSVSPHQAGRHALSGMLQQSGFEVREAATGAEALHLALEKPDLILIDFAPSDNSGLAFCYQIKASPATASIPILPLFLGPAESGGQVQGTGEAGDSSLAAAVEPKALIAAIETLLRVRVTEKKFQSFVEAAPDAVVIATPDGKIDQINAQTERLFGYGRDELLGQAVEMLMPERFRRQHAEHRAAYVAKPSTRPMETGLDLYGLRKNGEEFPVEISLSPLPTEEGVLVASIIQDISAHRQLEAEADKNLLIQQTINSILRISLEPISLDEQLHRVLDILIKLPCLALEAKGCIFLVEGDSKELVMKAHIGMPAGVLPHGNYCVPITCGGRHLGLLNLAVREGHRQLPVEERFLRAVADVLAGIVERQRTQEHLQEQLRLAAFARDVGLGLSQGDSLPDMLRQCAEALVRHLDGAFARIWTLNEADNVLELQASAGLYTHTDGAHRRVPVGQFKIGLIAQERQPQLTNAVLGDPRVHDQEWARREGLVAFVGYPLLVEDRLVGVLAMFARQPLSTATLESMASVANWVAVGIERKRTQERLLAQLLERTKAERRLAAEHAVSQILAVSSSLAEAASAILRAICESLAWDVGIVWAVDRKANVLRCVEVWHRPTIEIPAFEQDTRQRTYAPGIGLPGRIWADETLAWVTDLAAEANLPGAPVAAREGLHGVVGFPVRNEVELLGVMEFCSREIRQPDDELIQMMTSIGSQISQFIERRQAEGELRRQEEDRRIARQIQQGLLPKTMPTLPGFKISAKLLTADDVGGDCFDFIPFSVEGQEYLGVLVADASGHGIGAALLVGQTRAYLRALALACPDVGTLLTLSNRRLASDLVSDHFVTLFLLRLDPHTRSLLYANAGHWPGYVLDHQGQTKAVLASTDCPLGIDPATEFATGPTITLEPGELVFLYTDGIVEAASPDGKLFGLERTLGIVRAHQHETPNAILDALFDAVSDFSGHHLQDDITAVILKAEGVT